MPNVSTNIVPNSATRVLMATATLPGPTVSSIADHLHRSKSSVHFQLRKLRDMGLVDWEDGQQGTLRSTVAAVDVDIPAGSGDPFLPSRQRPRMRPGSWTELDPHSVGKWPYVRQAVYGLVDGDGHLFYVGHSTRLADRISTHRRRFAERLVTLRVICCSSWKEASALEAHLIRELRPTENIRHHPNKADL